MRFLRRKKQEESIKHILKIMSIIDTIPTDALGNSADSIEKLTMMYESCAELAYTIDGVRGLNTSITYFNDKARNIDEMMAISKSHLRVVSRHQKGDK